MIRRFFGCLFLAAGVLFVSWGVQGPESLRTEAVRLVHHVTPQHALGLTVAGLVAGFLGVVLLFIRDRRFFRG